MQLIGEPLIVETWEVCQIEGTAILYNGLYGDELSLFLGVAVEFNMSDSDSIFATFHSSNYSSSSS